MVAEVLSFLLAYFINQLKLKKMKKNIKMLLAQGKESQVKDSIVGCIRDFKKLDYTKDEIADTIKEIYGEQFLPFFNTQWSLL